MVSEAGYPVPGSRKKAMKGFRASPNSPGKDIIEKLGGMRAISRDMAMNAPLAVSILERHRIHNIGSGLQYQCKLDADFLGLSPEQADVYAKSFEREFDLWSESTASDYDGINYYGDNQALIEYSMMLDGDVFFMPVWRKPREKDFPYELCIKLIPADLVRNPSLVEKGIDVEGGVQFDSTGNLEGYHVWDTYANEYKPGKGNGKSKFIPAFDSEGRRQIYHVYDPRRIKQRRGVPLLAPVAELLKQMTRLAESEVMSILISSYFTVFISDPSGLGSLVAEAIPPEETAGGGGSYGPDDAVQRDKDPYDGNDVEMGVGNIVHVGERNVTIADPNKTDRDFGAFWDALATQICAASNIPLEQAQLKYETSYTAARAAANDVWQYRLVARSLINRKVNAPVIVEFLKEAVLRGRVEAPKFFEDYGYTRAWTRSTWVGSGQGFLDPLRESKAAAIRLNSFTATHEEIYTTTEGGRWDSAMDKRGSEDRYLEANGLLNVPDPTELIGPDGQEDEPEENAENDTV